MEPKKKQFLSFLNKQLFLRSIIALLLAIKWIIILCIISGFLAAGAVFGYASALVKDDPIRSKDLIIKAMRDDSITGFVYFSDDSVVGQLRSDEDRRLITLKDIPQQVLNATLSIEDRNFYDHLGVDINGIVRAVKQRLLKEEVQTGGSTITQQVTRRVFLNFNVDDSRKLKEILLSMRLERMISKEEILTAYLNKIPYGNGSSGYNVFGIKAAAKGIFDKDNLNDLNIAQSAFLAGLPQSPSNYSVFTGNGKFDPQNYKEATERKLLVLNAMLKDRKITENQFQEAINFDLKASLAQTQIKAYTTYPYLMVDVEKQATEILLKLQNPNLAVDTANKNSRYNEAFKDIYSKLLHGGYKIYTTIDKEIYETMHDISSNPKFFTPDDPKNDKKIEQIGAIMIDNKTGAILSMMEGRDFQKEQLNHATQAFRQPGSTMKPIAAYIPAIEKGVIQPGSIVDDVPIILKDLSNAFGYHIPENWDNDFHGLITARRALNWSYNIPAIRIFLFDVGIKEAWDYAKKMGINSITKEDSYAQTGVIGGLSKGVSVEELTNAYSTIANHGLFNDAYMIRKIVNNEGVTVFEHQKKPTKVFSEQTAYLMTDMMRTVITEGTATDLKTKFEHYNKVPIVGKTGSTQDDADAWFIGYTPDITLGVWAGYDQPVYKLTKPGGTNRAKSIWALVMDAVIVQKPGLFPSKEFVRPSDIVEMTVSNLSGKLPTELIKSTGHLVTDIFNKRYIPTEEDDVMVNMKYITFNGLNYIPNDNTPSEFLREKVVIKRAESISVILKKIKEIMEKMPDAKKKPVEAFIPLDATDDAPSELDPRKDDGFIPSAPTNLILNRINNSNHISFIPSRNNDIVGYRLYESLNREPFKRVSGKIIMAGSDPVFIVPAGIFANYSYMITAVDVLGKESQQSSIVFDNGVQTQPGATTSPTPGSTPEPGVNSSPGVPPSSGSAPTNSPSAFPVTTPSVPDGITLIKKGLALQINWKPNPPTEKITQYKVFYSSSVNGTYRILGTTTNSNQFLYYAGNFTGFYKVSAVNTAGESNSSSAVPFK